MKAAVFEKPFKMEIKEVEIPIIGNNDLLLKVKVCGVCATDVHSYEGRTIADKYPDPVIPGHEISGIVEAVGDNVHDFIRGDKLVVDPIVPCEHCDFCKTNHYNHCLHSESIGTTIAGGFAEYVAVPSKNAYRFHKAAFCDAALAEPLSTAVYGQTRAEIGFGDEILIMGAGPLGLLHLQLALRRGASRVVVSDLKPAKLEVAAKMGAAATVPGIGGSNGETEKYLRELAPLGFDVVIDATGNTQVLAAGMQFLKNTGRLIVFGVYPSGETMAVNPYQIYRRDIKIIGVFALNKTISQAIALIEEGLVRVNPVVAKQYPLKNLGLALSDLKSGKAEGKLQINMDLD